MSRNNLTEREKKIYAKHDFYKRICKGLRIMGCDAKDRGHVLSVERDKEFRGEDNLTYDQLYRRTASGLIKMLDAYEGVAVHQGCEEQDLKALRRSLVNVLEGWTTVDGEQWQLNWVRKSLVITLGQVAQEVHEIKWGEPDCYYAERDDGYEGEDAV